MSTCLLSSGYLALKENIEPCCIVWLKQGKGFSNSWTLSTLKLRLNDISKQDVMATIWSKVYAQIMRIFKNDCLFERYLISLSKKDIITLSRVRCRSHRLPNNNY